MLPLLLIPLGNERLHCGYWGTWGQGLLTELIPLGNERLHCGTPIVAASGMIRP